MGKMPSRSAVRRAGRTLADHEPTQEPCPEHIARAMSDWSAWRIAHARPLLDAAAMMSDTVKRHGIPVTCAAGRLKRTRTMAHKMRRMDETLALTSMRDIAGYRLVLPDEAALAALMDAAKADGLPIEHVIDHQTKPTPFGYRAIHLVMRVPDPSGAYGSLRVEIQLRTEVWHAWAAAVEAYDAIENDGVKFGWCDPDVSTYMRLASDALHEHRPMPDVWSSHGAERPDVIATLSKAAGAVEPPAPMDTAGRICLLTIHTDDPKRASLRTYDANDLDQAADDCVRAERAEADDHTWNLLVTAPSADDLTACHAGPFENASAFVSLMADIPGA